MCGGRTRAGMVRGESYAEWVPVREERLRCKRQTNDVASRLYSVFQCKYCAKEIRVASDGMQKSKKKTIDEHLAVCPAFEGERPAKRSKKAVVVCRAPDRGVSALSCATGLEREAHTSALEEELRATKAIVEQHEAWWEEVLGALGLESATPAVIVRTVRQLQCQATNHLTRTLLTPNDAARTEHQFVVDSMQSILEQKDRLIEQKDRLISEFQSQVLSKTNEVQRLEAERQRHAQMVLDASHVAREANVQWTKLSAQVDQLMREKEEACASLDAELKRRERKSRSKKS